MRIKFKITKLAMIVLAICGIVFLSVGCIGQSSSSTPSVTQIATVQKGSITIAVTGTGNLALKDKQSLSFGQTGLVTSVETAKVSS